MFMGLFSVVSLLIFVTLWKKHVRITVNKDPSQPQNHTYTNDKLWEISTLISSPFANHLEPLCKYTAWPNLDTFLTGIQESVCCSAKHPFTTTYIRVPSLPCCIRPPTHRVLKHTQETAIKPFPQVTHIRLVKALDCRAADAGWLPGPDWSYLFALLTSEDVSVVAFVICLRFVPHVCSRLREQLNTLNNLQHLQQLAFFLKGSLERSCSPTDLALPWSATCALWESSVLKSQCWEEHVLRFMGACILSAPPFPEPWGCRATRVVSIKVISSEQQLAVDGWRN